MEKKIIFAVAGSGKTTHIINSLSKEKRSLILTYTEENYQNLFSRISQKFGGTFPSNVTLLTYFRFLYSFCYRPFLGDKYKDTGLFFDQQESRSAQSEKAPSLTFNNSGMDTLISYYMTKNRKLKANLLAKLLISFDEVHNLVHQRIQEFYDNLFIDEIQDFGGFDYDFIIDIAETIDCCYVGDFYQHTYDTSRVGNKNKNLHKNIDNYVMRFKKQGFQIDRETLSGSYRCPPHICQFIQDKLGIKISSLCPNSRNGMIGLVTEHEKISRLLADPLIVKLMYKDSHQFGDKFKNWGEVKGVDNFNDVCIILTTSASNSLKAKDNFLGLSATTLHKLYVAISRSRRNCFLITQKDFKEHVPQEYTNSINAGAENPKKMEQLFLDLC